MLKKKQNINEHKASKDEVSIISEGTTSSGKINALGDVSISGCFKGEVRTLGKIVIGHSGVVEGDMLGKVVIVAGQVKGRITTSESIIIQSGGIITGDIITNNITVEIGGILNGNCKSRVIADNGMNNDNVPGHIKDFKDVRLKK